MTTTSVASRLQHALAGFAALILIALPLAASADPPGRAVRLSYVSGEASFAPAGSDDWVVARVNRPLWIGDRVWSANGYAELQIGGASLRLAPRTALTVLNFDDRLAQFEVTEGNVVLHVRAIDEREQAIELDTPSLAFVVRTEGDYRVDVDYDRTAVGVRRGSAEVWGAGRAFRIDRREQFVFYDAELRDYDVYAIPAADAFERWAGERSRREDRAVSARHVSPELVGYVDLDDHGDWRTEANLGSIWYPRVEANWAPYRYGHWTWIDPWGWTWVDDAPWGFAPFHYGRWTQVSGRWGWVPGPREVRPVYAPALVAWIGGSNFSLSVSSGPARGVAWFPLAPGEVWQPSYDVSRDYFTRVNVSNTYVNQTTIVNVYNDVRSGGRQRYDYRYRSVPQAMTVVPVDTFVESRPVHRSMVRVDPQVVARIPVAAAPEARPVLQSFVGAGARAQARPPAETMRRTVIAREAPPVAVPSLQDKVNLIRERGRPIDRQALEQQARPSAAAPSAGPSGSTGAEARPRVAPNELRSGVRVVGERTEQPVAIPPKPPGGVASTPRGPVVNVPGAAAQPGDEAARARANAAGERGASPARGAPPVRESAPARGGQDDRPAAAAQERAEPARPNATRGNGGEAPRGNAAPPASTRSGADDRTTPPSAAPQAPAPASRTPQDGNAPAAPAAPSAGKGNNERPAAAASPERPSPRGAGPEDRTMRPGPAPQAPAPATSRTPQDGSTPAAPAAPSAGKGNNERPAAAASPERPSPRGAGPEDRTMRPGPAPQAPATASTPERPSPRGAGPEDRTMRPGPAPQAPAPATSRTPQDGGTPAAPAAPSAGKGNGERPAAASSPERPSPRGTGPEDRTMRPGPAPQAPAPATSRTPQDGGAPAARAAQSAGKGNAERPAPSPGPSARPAPQRGAAPEAPAAAERREPPAAGQGATDSRRPAAGKGNGKGRDEEDDRPRGKGEK